MKKQNNEITYVPLNDHQKYNYLSDIDISSTLICKGYELVDIALNNQNKATFIFRQHLTISKTIEDFWGNRIEIHPLEFANVRKNLKSRIYGMRKN